MNKLGNIKKFIPLVIFLATIGLGTVSIVTSYRLQKAKQVTPKEAAAEYCEVGDYDCYRDDRYPQDKCAPGDGDCYSEACANDPWCCPDDDGGGGGSSFSGKVYCQDSGGPSIPIGGTTLQASLQYCAWVTRHRGEDDESTIFECSTGGGCETVYQPTASTDSEGSFSMAGGARSCDSTWDTEYWERYLRSLQVTSLPAEITFTLGSPVTISSITYPAGTYTIPSTQLQGPNSSCNSGCCDWYRYGNTCFRDNSCSGTTIGAGIRGCSLRVDNLTNLNFNYTNCFPAGTTPTPGETPIILPPAPTPTPTPTSTPTPGPTATPTPTPAAQCERCRAYDENWNVVTNPSTLQVGDNVYFATLGSTTDPAGITKARFRINGSASSSWCSGTGLNIIGGWCETTLQHGEEFYVPYTITSAGSYSIASMVYNPNLGWF